MTKYVYEAIVLDGFLDDLWGFLCIFQEEFRIGWIWILRHVVSLFGCAEFWKGCVRACCYVLRVKKADSLLVTEKKIGALNARVYVMEAILGLYFQFFSKTPLRL